jgi:hypothetical protein
MINFQHVLRLIILACSFLGRTGSPLLFGSAGGNHGISYWGINVHFTRTGATDKEISQVAQAYTIARMDLSWASIELTIGKYDFSSHDELFGRLKAKGVHAYFILDYGNQKLYPNCMDAHRPNTTATKHCINAFVKFAIEAMKHFSALDQSVVFELWNEPNTVFWEDLKFGNVTEYAKLAVAIDAARIASGIRSNTTLVGPAVAGFGTNVTWQFLEACGQLGCFRAFDAVSMHAYRNSEEGPESILPDLKKLKGILHNDSVKLISGEWGWSTCKPSQPPPNSSFHFNCGVSNSVADELGAARNLARQWLTNTYAGVVVSIYYDFIDDCPNPFDRECRFGTVRADRTPKPSYTAAWTLQQYLGRKRFQKRIGAADENSYALAFEGNRLAVWNVPVAGQSKNGTCPAHDSLPTVRVNCGHDGTTKEECEDAGCCFSFPPPTFGPQCFLPPLNSTKEITFPVGVGIQCWDQVTIANATLESRVCSNEKGWLSIMASETPILLIPEPAKVLKFNENGVFTIAQIADAHLGEGESSWGPRIDNHTYRALRKVLRLEAPLSLAVLSGDMLTGLNIDKNATSYWDQLVSVLDEQGLPHTAILGNHDAEPFAGTKQNQSAPGAKTNRSELMEHDTALPLSFSKLGPGHLRPAVSIYVVDVFSKDGQEPLLQLYHLDSGGGGMIEEVFIEQISWFEEKVESQRNKFNAKVPALVFVHIPMAEFQSALNEKKSCFGDAEDSVTPTVKNNGLFEALDATEEVLAVFVGHDHCNDFCCQFGKRSIDLCFGRHSGYGGYQCNGYEEGVRIITIQNVQKAGVLSVSTHIRLNNATIIHTGSLV